MHWETLRGETAQAPLSTQVPFVRVLIPAGRAATLPPIEPDAYPTAEAATSRILLVTARSGPSDVPVRAVSRPLREAVHGAVPVDTVRPGTLSALREHLCRHPAGRYSVLHLDLHWRHRGRTELFALVSDRSGVLPVGISRCRCCTSLLYSYGQPLVEAGRAPSAGTRRRTLVSCWTRGGTASERVGSGGRCPVIRRGLYAATVTVIAWGTTFSSGTGSPESCRSSR